MKKKILFSITSQFGYHTDTYMYCKYLDKSKYEIHYIGFDMGLLRREMEDIHIYYISPHKNKFKRYLIYISTINKIIRKENFDVLFLVNTQASLLIRLCNLRRKSIMDIRTGDVSLKKNTLSFFNLKVWVSSLFYRHITIISKTLQQRLLLPSKKCHLLPLGAEPLNMPDKSFDTINLFYIGTIQNRNIYQTVEGMAIFLKENKGVAIQYDIVGFGSEEDEKQLRESIDLYKLNEIITFHGRKNHDEVLDLFEKSNVGVTYIPITKGYTCQPTTKLYEYLLAGMPVIATKTIENELKIKQTDGVLINDTPEAFAQGIEEFMRQKKNYNSAMLKQKFRISSWENIVTQNLEHYLEKLC